MNINAVPFLLAIVLAACSPSQPAATPPLAGAAIGAPFTLTDEDGRRFADRSLDGQYRIVYFGYTFCPDVCPVDAQAIGAAMRLIERDDPALARRITPVFISVDPARDTPAVLKEFTAAFHPRFLGLTGTPAEIAAVAKSYGIFFQKGATTAGGGYMVDHSRQVYLMDPQGKPLALLPQDEGAEAIAREVSKWAR